MDPARGRGIRHCMPRRAHRADRRAPAGGHVAGRGDGDHPAGRL